MNEDIQLALIVSSIAIGATVVLGVLGYLINKGSDESAAPAERKQERNGA